MRAMLSLSRTRHGLVRPALRLMVLAAFALGGEHVAFGQTSSGTQPTAPKKDKKGDAKKEKKEEAPPASEEPKNTEGEAAAAEAPKAEPEEERSDDKEDKRAIYMSFDLAFARADVGGISDDTGFDKTGANGLTYSIAAGLRLRDLRFGGRWRPYSTTEFDLWSFMLEAGYGLPLRPISPVFFAHVGYVYEQEIQRAMIASSLPRGNVLTPNVDLRGVVVGAEAVGSYWITKFLRAGPYMGVDFLFLSREQVGTPQSIFPVPDDVLARPLYSESGSGIGYVLSIGVRGAFDVGF